MTTLENLRDFIQPEAISINQKMINRNSAVNEAYSSYLSSINLYLDRYSTYPNQIILEDIHIENAIDFFKNNFQYKTNDTLFSRRYCAQIGVNIEDYYFFMDDDIMVYFSSDEAKLYYKHSPEKDVYEIIEAIHSYKKERNASSPSMSVVVNSYEGLSLSELEIDAPDVDLQMNYNDDFLEVHKTIHERLTLGNSKGLVLLHGKPGTGKTTYIRYLIANLHKKVIFIPPGMAALITQPSLLTLLMKHKNAVLVIEDSETLISDREQHDSPVAALLNITDGLLSDCLSIQVICSFNTKLEKIDDALLRKGRLIARYEFQELRAEKANHLAKKLKIKKEFDTATKLADIYHSEDESYETLKSQMSIGFRS